MASIPEKKPTPPFVSHKSYINFINTLRDYQSLPDRIDKSLMPKASGSQIAATMAALKYLGHIDELGKPTESFKKFVFASDEERKPLMANILRERYDFLFSDENFDLSRATSRQVEEKFRSLDISGSTVTKTIAFFLTAAKEAGINVSIHVKAPQPPRGNGINRRQSRRNKEESNNNNNSLNENSSIKNETESFLIPIPGKESAQVIVPKNLDAKDWEMLKSMFEAYIERWKTF